MKIEHSDTRTRRRSFERLGVYYLTEILSYRYDIDPFFRWNTYGLYLQVIEKRSSPWHRDLSDMLVDACYIKKLFLGRRAPREE